jgi:hypothetical protein
MISPTCSTNSSLPHCPTTLTPTGHPSAPEQAGMLSAGKPARDAGTVSTSWTYVSRPESGLFVGSDEEGERGSSGAVRIAEGWRRTSMFVLIGSDEAEVFGG